MKWRGEIMKKTQQQQWRSEMKAGVISEISESIEKAKKMAKTQPAKWRMAAKIMAA
jgi:hypothetical protein